MHAIFEKGNISLLESVFSRTTKSISIISKNLENETG